VLFLTISGVLSSSLLKQVPQVNTPAANAPVSAPSAAGSQR
jgi:hypothetical protein